jgi:hypothetical protein
MGLSYGLHIKSGYDLPAMLTSPELDNVYSTVVQVRFAPAPPPPKPAPAATGPGWVCMGLMAAAAGVACQGSGVLDRRRTVSCAELGAAATQRHTNAADICAAHQAELSQTDVASVLYYVLQACKKHNVAPGVFCLGEARAAQLAAQGYQYVASDTDLGVIMNYSASTMAALKA